MGDNYVEQLVKRKDGPLQIAIKAGSVVAALVITYILITAIGIIALIAAFAICYGVYYVFIMTSVEYEYIYVNGELTVDTVYGRNKRRQAGVFDIKKSELMAPAKSSWAAEYNNRQQMKAFNFTSGEENANVFLIVVPYGAGNAKVYFEPNEDMTVAIRQQIPSKVKLQ